MNIAISCRHLLVVRHKSAVQITVGAKMQIWKKLVAPALLFTLAAGAASAQDKVINPKLFIKPVPKPTPTSTPKSDPPKTTAPSPILKSLPPIALNIRSPNMTDFDPATDGFDFVNTFKNVTGVFDITTGGLCGGMVYTALDYWKANKQIPQQFYTPVSGTDLQKYIYDRQMTALESHMDKWVELHGNPFGSRNSEFFNWGLQDFGGGRLQELKARIAANEPVPLGLKSLSGDPSADHVVLAYGYDMGRYEGRLGPYKDDLRIYVYDPNAGNQRVTLSPEAANQQYCFTDSFYHDGGKICWRTYFVQQNYRAQLPPNIPLRPNEIVAEIETGGDDLRGGRDNLGIEIALRGGGIIRADNVNLSQRWMGGTTNSVGVTIPPTIRPDMISHVTLRTNFRGGFDGDNWNVDRVKLRVIKNGAEVAACEQAGGPLVRFTGDKHTHSMPAAC